MRGWRSYVGEIKEIPRVCFWQGWAILALAFHGGQVASEAADGLGFPFCFLITDPSLCVVEWKEVPPLWGCRNFGWWTVPPTAHAVG
jgi:hypothetical protein